jgi:16S rRNA (cytosine967-C5)-methyltransferase
VKPEIAKDFAILPDIQADAVMLHAPNSRTGVFWREPSLKWRVRPETSEYFQNIQEDLLDRCSKMVVEGGNLVYWTRSIIAEEDECVIERFLARHPEYGLTPSQPRLGTPGLRGQNECQRFFPHLNNCDGAFLALMKRIA